MLILASKTLLAFWPFKIKTINLIDIVRSTDNDSSSKIRWLSDVEIRRDWIFG